MTQTFLDRPVLFKPPLLMWLSGLIDQAVRGGITAHPAAGDGGGRVDLRAGVSGWRGVLPWAALLLLVSDRLFHTLARVNMTDILLTACLVLAFWAFSVDTTLRTRRSFYGFAMGVALAILTKSIAGLLPFAVIGIFWLAARPENKPRIGRVAQAGLLALAIVLPWHIYQLVVHYEWFLAEYLGVQLLAFGAKPPQTSNENQILFYASRLLFSDPELALIALLALPGLLLALRKRTDPLAILMSAWFLVFTASLLIFQYRSVQYMLPLIPALAIVSATFLPALERPTTIAILCAGFVVKAVNPAAVWGMSYASGNTLPTAGALSQYCEQHRANDLMVLDPDDEFYSAVLPLAHVRYGLVDPNGANFALQPHLHWLGITESAEEFREGTQDNLFARRIRSWGWDDAKAVGTTIFARNVAEIQQIIAARPETDFLMPRTWLAPDSLAGHDVVAASRDRVFLISKTRAGTSTPRWSCRL